MKSFEQKLDFPFETQQKILNLVAAIENFNGKWQLAASGVPDVIQSLKSSFFIRTIGASTRIEGIAIPDEEVARICSLPKSAEYQSTEEKAVAGCRDVLRVVLSDYVQFPLKEANIKQMHHALMKYLDDEHTFKGRYKIQPSKVTGHFADGERVIPFPSTEPYLVHQEMTDLLEWVDNYMVRQTVHPLLRTGLFIYEFLSIHPFQDGTGRMSRLLTLMLMLKSGYPFAEFESLDSLIEERKEEYYTALNAGQKNRYEETEDPSAWIVFFLEMLKLLTKKLEGPLKLPETDPVLRVYLNTRQKEIVAFISENQPVKIGDILKNMPGLSRNTLKKDMKKLTETAVVRQTGSRKGAYYSI